MARPVLALLIVAILMIFFRLLLAPRAHIGSPNHQSGCQPRLQKSGFLSTVCESNAAIAGNWLLESFAATTKKTKNAVGHLPEAMVLVLHSSSIGSRCRMVAIVDVLCDIYVWVEANRVFPWKGGRRSVWGNVAGSRMRVGHGRASQSKMGCMKLYEIVERLYLAMEEDGGKAKTERQEAVSAKGICIQGPPSFPFGKVPQLAQLYRYYMHFSTSIL